MFEVLVREHAYKGILATAASRGEILYKASVNSAGETLLNLGIDSARIAISMYPIDRITMYDHYGDTSPAIDDFVAGDECIFYEGGTFRTDKIVWDAAVPTYSTPNFPDDSGAYTYASGAFAKLWTSTNAACYGWLSTTHCFSSASLANKNLNFELLRIWGGSPNPGIAYDGERGWIAEYRIRTNRIGLSYRLD